MSDTSQIFISENDFRNRYQYSQKDLLGEGGFAQVFKAFDKQFKEYVALKFFNKGEEGKYDVLHEMKDSRKYAHKNIIRIHDAFIVKFENSFGQSLVQVGILEYADGGNLRDFIATTPPESKFLDVLVGILGALDYLHKDKKIIHRDLSPENILMFIEGDNWIPKIADFGISKKVDIVSDSKDQQKSTMLLGKVSYMAPEQFYPEKFGIHNAINTNVDLWSFGVILYELFTQKKPFGAESLDNPLKTIQSITNDPLPDLNKIPDPYRSVIRKCLVKDANSRVKSAAELVTILNKSPFVTENKPASTMPLTDFKIKGLKKRYFYYGIAAVLFLLVSGYLIFRPYQPGGNEKKAETQFNSDTLMAGIIKIFNQRKYYTVINTINSLPNDLKLQKPFIDLIRQTNDSIEATKIDSIMNLGDQSFNNGIQASNDKNIEQALLFYNQSLIFYNKVLNDYSRADVLAQNKINRVKKILGTQKTLKVEVDTHKVAQKNKSSEIVPPILMNSNAEIRLNYTIKKPPGYNGIKLVNISNTDKNTIISLQLSPTNYPFAIFGPGNEDAYYIKFISKKGELSLKNIEKDGDIQLGKIIGLDKSTIIKLIFDKLPEDVKDFDLIQGKERLDEGIFYYHFEGINIKSRP
jgi:serine/threonine protein kinase